MSTTALTQDWDAKEKYIDKLSHIVGSFVWMEFNWFGGGERLLNEENYYMKPFHSKMVLMKTLPIQRPESEK
ncbi:UNVERIFIED_CONTAM: hypothetical protein FKN15_015274 [Acipenser sinensis]